MKKVTIVIPNYNGEQYLETCLVSLQNQTYKDFEVVVVDNASADKSTSYIKEQYPNIKLIQLDKNYGFCKAVNVGIEESQSPYVILLNNDTKADEGFVGNLVNAMERHPKAFSCAPKMLQYHNPELIDDAGDLYNALGWAFAVGKDRSKGLFNKEREIFAACGGASIYRKSVLNRIGIFDESHFAYLEDIDIGYRSRIYGYKNFFIPEAVVYHVGSGSSGSRYNAFKTSLAARNSVYLIYKNMPWLQILLNFPFLIIGFLIKYVYFIKIKLGKEYAAGLLKGIKLCNSDKKVPFKVKNLLHYFKIQVELWINIIKRFL